MYDIEEERESFECYESVTTVTEDREDYKSYDESQHSGESVRITREQIKEVEQELCLIKLCWPEIDLRGDVYLRSLPHSYSTLTDKEKLLAWYAENFRQQFVANYPDRNPLLLARENECGIQKFVSTTIRRSMLPYPELYTWQGCGKFVSDYVEYEPLERPLSMPKQLRTPTWVQKFQKGHCFECATFLASLLLAQGYNAYVVSGYACKEQTVRDLTKIRCPYLPEHREAPLSTPEDEEVHKYEFKPPPDMAGEFLLEFASVTELGLHDKSREREDDEQRLIEELSRPQLDEYWGHRIHAWVVILPELGGLKNHEIPEPLFIEPSTGVSYLANVGDTGQLYLGVESLWNDRNYWVNMQPNTNSCATIDWDLSKSELWEHLLPGEPWTVWGASDETDEETVVRQEKHLDMPFSYVNEIHITEPEYERRYPNGTKTLFYNKVKVELFTPYLQEDGLVERLTLYDDYHYMLYTRIHEIYANRSDNLIESRRNLNDESIIDYYKRGRPDQCKEHRYFTDSPDTVDTERIIDFYHVARFDGLSRLEMHPTYITQHFVDRDDFLYYRHAEFVPDRNIHALHNIHYRVILKIIEKFERNEKIKPCRDIAICELALNVDEIRITYHYQPGLFSRATRTYIKPPLAERGARLVLNPALIREYSPLDEPVRSLEILYELDTLLKEEDKSIARVRDAETEVYSFLRTRDGEYLSPRLMKSAYDKFRDTESVTDMTMVREMSERVVVEEVNYLKPYMARLGSPLELSISEARALRYECLTDYKQLLINRANKILRMFDEYTLELAKLQAELTQNEDMTRDEEEQIMEKMNDINFLLQTLETRLNRHRDLVPKRYKMLVDHLDQCSQLVALRNDNDKKKKDHFDY